MSCNVSAVILTKDEEYKVVDCINHLKEYIDDIIIVDSSEYDIIKRIISETDYKYYKIEIGKDGVEGFNDLRNFGNGKAGNDWVLHVDVDELFSDAFLKNINKIISDDEKNEKNDGKKIASYTFPRINLPFYEKYEDYQTRLVNKERTRWIGNVHEKVHIVNEDYNIILNNYPIIHMAKENKVNINKRWHDINDKKEVLIISMFKNGEMFINRFFESLNNMISYSMNNGYSLKLFFIESDSDDNTHELIIKNLNELRYLHTNNENFDYDIVKLDISDNLDRFDKLAILRNMSIKLGLENEDYVMMIDSDVVFDKDLLDKLYTSLSNSDYDVISPLVFIEDFRDYGNSYFYDTLAFIKDGECFSHFYPYINSKYYDELIKNDNVIEVDSVGTCYLAKSEIFNINDFKDFNILKCYKEIENGKKLVIYEGNGISEQVRFFENVRNFDYKIMVDMNIKILHFNLEKYGMRWH